MTYKNMNIYFDIGQVLLFKKLSFSFRDYDQLMFFAG